MNIIWSDNFEDDIKFYVKKKKYTKILADIEPVINELQTGNLVGDKLDNIKTPENTAVYKVRVANSSINVGKSNGFRIIYYLAVGDEIYLVTIYSKKDKGRGAGDFPNDKQIELLVKNIISE